MGSETHSTEPPPPTAGGKAGTSLGPIVRTNGAVRTESRVDPWIREQFADRFRNAQVAAAFGGGALILAILIWLLAAGSDDSSESTTQVTVLGARGTTSSEVKVSHRDPLEVLAVALAGLGLGLTLPLLSWTLSPGAKMSAFGTGLEAGSLPVPTEAEANKEKAAQSTAEEVKAMESAASDEES